MLSTAIPELLHIPSSGAFMKQLGYPESINTLLGIAKILGIIAVLVPGYPRVKEWAYAGFTFDLIGATYAQIAAGMMSPGLIFMLVFFIPLIVSYIYYHKILRAQVSPAVTN